jgi:hypothetical protein
MPGHFLLTASITVVAAGLGVLTQHAHGHTDAAGWWLLCAGLATYLTVSALVVVRLRTALIAPGIAAVALALAPIGGLLPAWAFAVALAACVGAQVLVLRRFAGPAEPAPAGPE